MHWHQLLEQAGSLVLNDEEIAGLPIYLPCKSLTIKVGEKVDEIWLLDFFARLDAESCSKLDSFTFEFEHPSQTYYDQRNQKKHVTLPDMVMKAFC